MAELNRLGWYTQSAGGIVRPVATKPANAWGLYDMFGNAEEWCLDWSGPYPGGSVIDPTGPTSGSNRICRGGCATNYAFEIGSAARNALPPYFRGYEFGFRLALALKPPAAVTAIAKVLTYTDTTDFFSFTYPYTWTLITGKGLSPKVSLRFYRSDENGVTLADYDLWFDVVHNRTLADYVEEVNHTGGPKHQMGDVNKFFEGRYLGQQFTYAGKSGYFLEGNGNIYIITLFHNVGPSNPLNDVLNTFRIVDDSK